MKIKPLLLVLSLMGISIGLSTMVLADREYEYEYEDEHEHEEHGYLQRWFGHHKPVIDSVESNLYAQECGSCHFAYQPGLLPAASWRRIMRGLEDHFGENAELGETELNQISRYLQENAANLAARGLPNRINASLGKDQAPLRITETRFFRHEHDEIPDRMVRGNDQVRSFSNCDACHNRAAQGSFREHEIRIPGYGRWDD